ncbi:MAG: phage gp6-like head-tail connector protein, partial [Bacteroidales bacterium]|nr:phage gp6-like head-tail connector protein [Bacteroidales bacterium]
ADFTEDDQYILGLIQAAEEAVKVHINDDLDTIAENNGGCVPAPIIQAILLQIGAMYQNREIVGTKTSELPFSYLYLIRLYQNWNR